MEPSCISEGAHVRPGYGVEPGATSFFPAEAGVQLALLGTLLAAGASDDGAPGEPPVVNGCLANGRPQAAQYLAERGARLDLEGAAGMGRLDQVRRFLDEHGPLQARATLSWQPASCGPASTAIPGSSGTCSTGTTIPACGCAA
ncbi:hypothetical protein PAECIP111802_07116 [Paenibacillus allorhizosphaerae]|uniref:Ankyrin repeat domain-containing protein n=1 Tax=Paenibacillus allorhizosphaerae TaxID=2849866 RepID=A0ABM8VU52_9BACL|nr:hypothetical protein PAECIP111802_07116 [Paenibacillus allorhizosphaerae]